MARRRKVASSQVGEGGILRRLSWAMTARSMELLVGSRSHVSGRSWFSWGAMRRAMTIRLENQAVTAPAPFPMTSIRPVASSSLATDSSAEANLAQRVTSREEPSL